MYFLSCIYHQQDGRVQWTMTTTANHNLYFRVRRLCSPNLNVDGPFRIDQR